MAQRELDDRRELIGSVAIGIAVIGIAMIAVSSVIVFRNPGLLGRGERFAKDLKHSHWGWNGGVDTHPGPGSQPACRANVPQTDDGRCLSWEEQANQNMRQAERLPFEGDRAEAEVIASEVRDALRLLVETSPTPNEEELQGALEPWLPSNHDFLVSDNAVHMAGIGFGFEAAGGCIFGQVFRGKVTVQFGGPVDDGGCLAVHGH